MQESSNNDWLQISIALGVFVGLLLVTYEIRNLNQVLAKENTLTITEHFFDHSMSGYESDIYELLLKSVERPEEMSSSEIMKLSSYMTMLVSIYDQWFSSYELGASRRESLDRLRQNTNLYFGSNFGRAWFDENRETMRADLADTIADELATNSEWTVPQYVQTIKSRL